MRRRWFGCLRGCHWPTSGSFAPVRQTRIPSSKDLPNTGGQRRAVDLRVRTLRAGRPGTRPRLVLCALLPRRRAMSHAQWRPSGALPRCWPTFRISRCLHRGNAGPVQRVVMRWPSCCLRSADRASSAALVVSVMVSCARYFAHPSRCRRGWPVGRGEWRSLTTSCSMVATSSRVATASASRICTHPRSTASSVSIWLIDVTEEMRARRASRWQVGAWCDCLKRLFGIVW
jgi:hypothetical protein